MSVPAPVGPGRLFGLAAARVPARAGRQVGLRPPPRRRRWPVCLWFGRGLAPSGLASGPVAAW